jgi:hypothetical protein
MYQLFARAFAQTLGHGLQHARPAFQQDDFGAGRVDVAEFAGQRVAGNLGHRAGHFHARGATTDHHKIQPRGAAGQVGLFLGRLKRQQDAPADFKRIVQRLQARRMRSPVVAAKVAVGGAGRHDQVVVGQGGAAQQVHLSRGGVDVRGLTQQRGQVGLAAKQVAYGRGNGRGRQAGSGNLVQQGLKQVVVGLVHQGHIYRGAVQGAGGFQAAKAAADDHDAGADVGACRAHAPIMWRRMTRLRV